MPRHRIQSSRIINIYFSKMNYFRNYNYIHGVNDTVFVSYNRPTCIWTLFFWIIRDIVKVWGGVYDRTYLAIYIYVYVTCTGSIFNTLNKVLSSSC